MDLNDALGGSGARGRKRTRVMLAGEGRQRGRLVLAGEGRPITIIEV